MMHNRRRLMMNGSDGIVFLSHIQSDETQYINTGYNLHANMHIVTDLSVDRSNIGAGTGKSMTGWRTAPRYLTYAYVSKNKDVSMYYDSTYTAYTSADTTSGTRHTARYYFNGSRSYLYINGTQLGNRYHSTIPSYALVSYPVFLFCSCGVNNDTGEITGISGKISATLYSVKIYSGSSATDDTLVRNFVPAKLGEEVGLYETIQQKFYPSDSGTNFIPGEAI